MAEPRAYKDPEVQKCCGEIWSSQSVEKSNNNKWNDVLQVILMAPGDGNSSSGYQCRVYNTPDNGALIK